MSQREEIQNFEKGRIQALQEERLHIQKKTFTKWVNSFLSKVRMEVDDLFVDLSDGRKLLRLLEIISGEKLGKPSNGKMRVHKIENVNKSLAFLLTKVRLESIGAEDIVDGNRRLILGLIWTIILRFQIQEIIDGDEDNNSEKKSAREALLLWCQRKTAGYKGVEIKDFSSSWRNGLGFNALIHAHRPDLIDFDNLNPSKHIENLNNAFDIAHRDLGVTRLLDAEDIDVNKPDEKSVMTYVATYYHKFAKMKTEITGSKRIANMVGQMMDIEKSKNYYETFTTTLLDWITAKLAEIEDRNFPNTLDGIQAELLKFKQYRTEEKPPKYRERSEIEAMLFSIQTKLKYLNQPLFNPPEGKLVHDIERAWQLLEKAEHRREVALRNALLQQEKLEQLAYKFERKSVLREGYLKEMVVVLSDPRYGSNIVQVEATIKKHEAISADILARADRFRDLSSMAKELSEANYHRRDAIVEREKIINEKWNKLLQLLEKHRQTLHSYSSLMTLVREADATVAEIKALETTLSSDEFGKHLIAIEDLVQKRTLMESQIAIHGETVRRLNIQGAEFIANGHKDGAVLQKRLDKMNTEFKRLTDLCKAQQEQLESAMKLMEFIEDHEEEEAWVKEKQQICRALISGKDLRAVISLQQKHKVLENEMKARYPKSEQLFKIGEAIIAKSAEPADVKSRVSSLQDHWKKLHELAAKRTKQLEDAVEAYQFYADANEAESWMNDKLSLVTSEDYGKDESSGESQLQRHKNLENEIKAYTADIQRLNEQADSLAKDGITSLSLSGEAPVQVPEIEEDYVEEIQLVPIEEEVKETFYREIIKDVTQEHRVPQLQALYPFNGQGIEMSKGEIMVLVHKTNEDWWNVRKSNGREGFVPALYVKEIEPKVFRKTVQKPVKVPETRIVKKIVNKKQLVRRKVQRSPRMSGKSLRMTQPRLESETILQRQQQINEKYDQLNTSSNKRRQLLEDAIRLFGFSHECDDFDNWMKEKEKLLTGDDGSDNVEARKRKFEQFLTDLSACSGRLDVIDEMAEELCRTNHSQMNAIRHRQQQMHDRLARLNRLKLEKERSIQGATSVELFNRNCDEACEWMQEKMNKLDTDDLGMDLKTVQALQRKHQNLERELAPVEEKVKKINQMANSVITNYPLEKGNVEARQVQLQQMWEEVQIKAKERRARLEESVGLLAFNNSSKSLLIWAETIKQILSISETASDVQTAQHLLKVHGDLYDDIKAHDSEFVELESLGTALMKANPENNLNEKMILLHSENQAIQNGWKNKEARLQQSLKLQFFNREADQIDAMTGSHETFLEFNNLGLSIDEVNALIKSHDDFENTLIVHDERLKIFSDTTNKLVQEGHEKSDYINDRRNQVLQRRAAVKDKSHQRKGMLLESRAYHEFAANAREMNSWIQEKLRTAKDESYKDLNNLERKLKKHEAFESELKANEGRLRDINSVGDGLVTEGHYATDSIRETLDDLNQQWNELCDLARDKSEKLQQATALHLYNKTIDDVQIKLKNIESDLNSTEIGADMQGINYLLKRHEGLENDLNNLQNKAGDLTNLGEKMAKEGHYDAEGILNESEVLKEKCAHLEGPVSRRREQLETALELHKFIFEVDAELQWITEHLPLATNRDLGQSLLEVQNLMKKQQKLEWELSGHQPVIDKVLIRGKQLIEDGNASSAAILAKCLALTESWDGIGELTNERKNKLILSLRAQQFFHEANELEGWMNEKNDLLQSEDYGKDEDAANKLLTKQKALELEVDTYSGLVAEIGNQAQGMIDAKHPDMKMIQNRQQMIMQEMKTLQKLAGTRRMKLMESRVRHEYFRESEELEKWINEQMQTAKSEDFGQDYEHVIILQNKFDDFKQRVDNNSERFTQCEDLAKKLLSNDTPYSGEIQHRQEQLTKSWNYLLEQIELRGQKLASATEIHCFNRDVSETLFRIQEKYAAISDDLGRDVNSAMSLLRKHEGFENDLVPLEARLQVLLDDSAQLQMAYQGRNAEHISEQQAVFLENWGTLQERSTKRKKELQASCDLQRFLASVRDLTNWANSLRLDIMTEEKVRDVNGAKTLYYEHERIKVEIKAREESFGNVVRSGQTMVSDQHYASEEIANKLQLLLDARESLHAAWQRKHVFLEQLIDLHFFLRDAKQLDTTSSSQESYLTKIVIGLTVDEVAAQVKKLDEFEILVLAQDEKLAALQDQAVKLIEQQHYDSANVKTKMEEVTMHRARVKESFRNQKNRMADILLYKHFDRDVAEAESWIDEKMKKLNAENLTSNVASLEAKIKKLQKHQAFQSELTANKQRIMFIQENGEKLLNKRHEESPRIRRQLDQLMQDWKELLLESENRGKGLEEAQDILEFNNQIEKIEAWIREKDLMVQANDVGRDLEHCQALLKRLDAAESDMQIDGSRMQNINALAEKIIRLGRSDTRSIQQRREEVNQKWRGLEGAIDNYNKQLTAALELHIFSRDCDELDERINEKAIAVSVEDTGKDLSGVETLQRKLDALESEITTIEAKLKEQDLEARKLIQKYPERAAATRKKHSEVQENWRNLLTKCHARKNLLQNSHTLQKFYARLHEIQSWVEVMRNRMNENLLAKDIPSAKHQLELHQERKAEIDGRQEGFRKLKEFGHRIVINDHYAKEEVEEQLTLLEELRRTVIQAWEEKNQILSQCLDLQKFYNMADKCDTWIASKEAFLNNEDFGDSISSVEVLIRKHEGFEKTVDAQSGQISALEKFSTELIAYKHYASGDIQDRLQQVCQRQDRLKELAKVRQNKLRESKQLQHFLRNIHEVFGWIHEKQITASDENYLDSTNLQGKIEKHQVFEAELMANKNRVDAVNKEGESLIGAGHFAAMEVQMKLDELEALWRKLFDSTQLKKERLYDAYQALLLTRTLDEIDAWMDDVEKQLQSEDHGEDLNSVQKLLKKHQQLEATIHSQSEQMEQAKDKAANLCNNNHFMKEEIQERVQAVDKRFSNLHEPVQIRKDNLEEALQLQQLLRDVDDELSWVKEKEWLASSSDLGNSLTAVQNLQKKHHSLEAEIQVHEPISQSVVSRGQQMIRNNHFASQTVEKAIQNFLSQLQQLKDSASIRRLRLLDAVESQLFYTEINEALTWVEDKKQILSSGDFGKDQESVQVLLKKHDGLQRDVEGFGSNVGRLHQISQRLIDRGHFDAEVIKRKQFEVDEAYNEIQKLSEMRRRRLSDSKKLFKFLNESSDVAEWINEQAIVVSSEDNGRDLEHVEILIQKFDKFLSTLIASEVKVTNITMQAQLLIDTGHPEPEKIRYKADEILQLWEDLKDDAQQRKEELAGAKEVHTFDRKADETITWILEKQASLSNFDSDSDLEAIQILIRKHESYERDLVAVKDQVEFVIGQASQLIINFPNAQDHIKVKSSKAIEVWNSLLEAAALRKEQLNQAEQLQAYFNNCKELLSWLAEVRKKIESTELARDVSGMELLISRHKEIEVEINSRKDALRSLIDEGQKLIDDEHFMSDRIQKMVTLLSTGLEELQEAWKRRDHEYQVEHDRQLFYRSTEQHLSWVKIREPIINDGAVGSSINEVEDLIRKHEDFEKTLQAQDEKIKEIQRTTLIEEVFNRRRRLEEEEKKLESLKREQERLDALKKKEQQKILDERRNDGERRRTQEIKFNKELVEVPLNGDSHQSRSTSQERINRIGQELSGASSPLKALSRRGSLDISESLKLSIPKNITEPGPNHLRRVESMRSDAHLKTTDSNMSVKRAESMKDDGQKRAKQRVPSFSTRKRSSSKGHKLAREEVEHEMPPVEMKGILERKQEFQNGGKKATIRSWKTYFTILCGQLMCFFKDEYDFIENKAASQPLNIHNATCTLASNYTKKKHVFRLHLSDGADYLFAVEKADLMEEWVKKLDFYASIPPSMQLISYGTRRSVENNNQSSSHSEGESNSRPRQNSASSVDSYSSAIEDSKVAANPSGESTTRSSGRIKERNGAADVHIYANVPVVGPPSVPPPVPPPMEKVKPPVPIRSSSFNSYPVVINENVLNNNNRSSVPYSEVDYYHSALPLSLDNDLSHGIGIRNNSGSGRRQHLTAAELASLGSPKTTNYNQQHRVDEVLPPMPVSQPPSLLNSLQRPPSNMSSYTSEDTEDDWPDYNGDENHESNNHHLQFDGQNNYSVQPASLPMSSNYYERQYPSAGPVPMEIRHSKSASISSTSSPEKKSPPESTKKKKWWHRK